MPVTAQQKTSISNLPPELIEEILSVSSVDAVSAFSQTSKAYHRLVYHPTDNHLWRALFLNQKDYDDPRLTLGKDAVIPWDTLLRRWTAAEKALRAHAPRYTLEILQTLIEMVEYSSPASGQLVFDSKNLDLLRNLLRDSGLLNQTVHPGKTDNGPNVEYSRALSRLKLYAGMEAVVITPSKRLHARSFVYNLRNYHRHNHFGPFIPDGSGRVNWEHLYAIHEVISMNLLDSVVNEHTKMTIKHIQAGSIPRLPVSNEHDWAGLEGRWQVVFCFCDHGDLLAFNQLEAFHDVPDPSVFEDKDFEEAVRFLEFELRLIDIEKPAATASTSYVTLPTLDFVGKVSGNARVKGQVYMTPDQQVRWSFLSGEPGETMWRKGFIRLPTEAVQVGGIASAYGALGAWTTNAHDVDDPVGPMWLWKLPD